ncbi:MAG: hypothetical protein JW881_19730 [Spirochaetales bacterium]|nr:hypothetical protein [Spirochaetales bacterium]
MIKRTAYIIALTGILVLALSCVSQPPSSRKASGKEKTGTEAKLPALPEEKEYSGGGKSESLGEAMRLSKAEAVKQGVIEIIGAKKESDNKGKLEEIIYNSRNVGDFAEMIERTRKDKVDDEYVYEALYMVNLAKLTGTLKAHGIIEGVKASEESVIAIGDDEDEGEADEEDEGEVTDEEVYGELTREEEKYIKRYVDKMTFLVFFAEGVTEDPYYIKGAITLANDYLISNGRTAIDFATAEKLKEDNIMVYEEETGGSISIIQWIAQQLNADVYIEFDGKTEGRSEAGGKYYGTANVQMKAYEASTGELVGSVAYNQHGTNASFSKVSEEAARLSSIQAVVYSKIMPQLFEQINKNMMDKIKKLGIRYEIVIQQPPNDRIMSKLWKKIGDDIKSYDLLYQTEDEFKYAVYFIGDIEDLKNVFYDASETISELEEMYAVLARGKTITFNSGL